MKSIARNERGILHIPLAMIFLAIVVFSLGAWGLLRNWRHLAELQLRLDECAGKKALDLRASMNRIETENLEMTVIRTSLASSFILLPFQAELRAALQVQAGLERLEQAKWRMNEATWLASRGCSGSGDVAHPLPDFPWTEDPPDMLGPRPLRLDPGVSALRVQVDHPPRRAAALVNTQTSIGGFLGSGRKWQAHWTKPESPQGSLAKIAGSGAGLGNFGQSWPAGPGLR